MSLQRFAWSDDYKTGVPLIDIQHKELFLAFNDLADAIEQGHSVATLKKILNFLHYYIEWHFGREELCAFQYQCPAAEANKHAHTKFVELFNMLDEEYRQGGADEQMAYQIHQFLADWIVNHLLKVDKQIGVSYLAHQANLGVSANPS